VKAISAPEVGTATQSGGCTVTLCQIGATGGLDAGMTEA
jgi:hypothetical protein